MKMPESAYDTSIREFRITDRGVVVESSFESAEAILTGLGRAGAELASRPPAKKRGSR